MVTANTLTQINAAIAAIDETTPVTRLYALRKMALSLSLDTAPIDSALLSAGNAVDSTSSLNDLFSLVAADALGASSKNDSPPIGSYVKFHPNKPPLFNVDNMTFLKSGYYVTDGYAPSLSDCLNKVPEIATDITETIGFSYSGAPKRGGVDGDVMLVATGSSLIRSLDGGATWSLVGNNLALFAIASNKNGLWAGINSQGKVYLSDDNGSSWIAAANFGVTGSNAVSIKFLGGHCWGIAQYYYIKFVFDDDTQPTNFYAASTFFYDVAGNEKLTVATGINASSNKGVIYISENREDFSFLVTDEPFYSVTQINDDLFILASITQAFLYTTDELLEKINPSDKQPIYDGMVYSVENIGNVVFLLTRNEILCSYDGFASVTKLKIETPVSGSNNAHNNELVASSDALVAFIYDSPNESSRTRIIHAPFVSQLNAIGDDSEFMRIL